MSRNSLYYSWDASVSLKYVSVFKRRKKGQKTGLCKLVNSLDLFVRSPSTGYTFERCRRYDSELPKNNNEKSWLFKGDNSWVLATLHSPGFYGLLPFAPLFQFFLFKQPALADFLTQERRERSSWLCLGFPSQPLSWDTVCWHWAWDAHCRASTVLRSSMEKQSL